MGWAQIVSEIVFPIIGILVTVLVVPWLRAWLSKKTASQDETNKQALALATVKAAEQLYGNIPGTGKTKYTYAQNALIRLGISEQDANRLIESAVFELNRVASAVSQECISE